MLEFLFNLVIFIVMVIVIGVGVGIAVGTFVAGEDDE